MNQLKHLMGIPITLSNGLALRGSTFSRSAGTNGRNPKRSGKLLVVTGDDDDAIGPKLASKSYARIIEDYSRAIETRNAAAKLNEEVKTNDIKRFFSKTPFQRLARVSSLVNINNAGNNGGFNLCMENSSRCSNLINTNHKSPRSKSGLDGRGISDEVIVRAEWLDYVGRAHNVKKITKNVNLDNDCDYEKSKAHSLVQSLPESRATRKANSSSFNDSCSFPANKFPVSSANDVNNISKMSKTEMKILKNTSDKSGNHSLPVKKMEGNLEVDVNKISTRIKTENTNPKSENNTSVDESLHVKKIQDNSNSNVNSTPKKSRTKNTITKSISNTSVNQNLHLKQLQDNSSSNLSNTTKKSTTKSTITKSTSNTRVIKNLHIKEIPDNSTSNVINTPKQSTQKSTITKSTSNTSVNKNSSLKKLPGYTKNDVNNMSKSIKSRNTITKSVSNTSIHKKLPDKKVPDNLTYDVNNTSKKTRPGSTIKKSISDTSVHNKTSIKNIPQNLARDVNDTPRRSKTKNATLKSTSDKSLRHTSSVKKLRDDSTRDAKITSNKSNPTEKTNSKNQSNAVDRYCSSVKKMSRTLASNVNTTPNLKTALNTAPNSKTAPNTAPNLKTAPAVMQRLRKTDKNPAHNSSGDTNVESRKLNITRNVNQKSFNDSVDRSYYSVEKQSEPSTSNVKNISVTVQRLPKADKARELSKPNSQDDNMMLVTVTENSKTSSTLKSSLLRHIDFQINGKPATEVDSVINKVDKLGVVSSAEKIEITIPVLSEGKEAIGDNLRSPNSTINLCISSQAKESTGSNKDLHMSRAEENIDFKPVRSKSCLTRPSTRITSTMKNSRRPELSTYRSKVIPWWTNADSFRRCEIVSGHSTKVATNTTNLIAKMSPVEPSPVRVNQEAHDRKSKKVTFIDVPKASDMVAKPSSSREEVYIKKRASVVSKVIANETQKKIEPDERERQICKHLTLEELKTRAKSEAKTDISLVKSTTSNEQKIKTTSIESTTPKKTDQANKATPDTGAEKNTTLPKNTSAASGSKLITVEIEPDKKVDINKKNDFSNQNNFRGRSRAKPISEIIKGKLSVSKNRKATSTRQNSEGKPISKIAVKLRQEVIAKSDTHAAPQLPRTHGNIRLLTQSQSLAKSANSENNSHSSEPVKPSERKTKMDDELSKVKNATITMKPIEKKKDGTLIDYGVTVNTRKKPERKLSGMESTVGLQGKNVTKQKETAVVATVKEVMPKSNKDTHSNTINPRGIQDSDRSRNHVLNKNVRSTSEPRISPNKSENTSSKVTTNESANLKTYIEPENKDFKDSDKSPVNDTQSAADKKLVYSVWLRRFKERTGQDPDPTKDPSSSKP